MRGPKLSHVTHVVTVRTDSSGSSQERRPGLGRMAVSGGDVSFHPSGPDPIAAWAFGAVQGQETATVWLLCPSGHPKAPRWAHTGVGGHPKMARKAQDHTPLAAGAAWGRRARAWWQQSRPDPAHALEPSWRPAAATSHLWASGFPSAASELSGTADLGPPEAPRCTSVNTLCKL